MSVPLHSLSIGGRDVNSRSILAEEQCLSVPVGSMLGHLPQRIVPPVVEVWIVRLCRMILQRMREGGTCVAERIAG